MRKVRKKFKRSSRKNKKREASEVMVAEEVVVVVVMGNHEVVTVTVSKEVGEVAEIDPKPRLYTLRSPSSRVKTSKCTQRQADSRLKSKSRDKVILKLTRTITLCCDRMRVFIEY